MIFFKLVLFMFSGILVTYGLVLQVRGVMQKALVKKGLPSLPMGEQINTNQISCKTPISSQINGGTNFIKSYFGAKEILEKNLIFTGICAKLSGFFILGYLILSYKTQDLFTGLIVFFLSGLTIISWILLARRVSIR